MTTTAQANAPPPAAAPPNFDRLAGIYCWMEWLSFGPWLSRCRSAFLDRLGDRGSALVIGDGDGRFTAALLRSNPEIEVDAVDASGAMLASLRQRAGAHGKRVRTDVADARRWRPSGDRRYDVVATHFFLDCLTTEEVRRMARAIRPALTPDAVWVLSEFDIPGNMYGRLFAGPLVCFLYRTFALLTGLSARCLPDYRKALRDAGFSRLACRSFLGGLLVSEFWGLVVEPDRPPLLKAGQVHGGTPLLRSSS